MPNYPHDADYRRRMEHIFQRYVSWGLANTAGRYAIARLSASGQISDDTRLRGMESFLAVSRMVEEAVRDDVMVDAPIPFLFSVIENIADTTIAYAEQDVENVERHRQLGFHVVWRAITM